MLNKNLNNYINVSSELVSKDDEWFESKECNLGHILELNGYVAKGTIRKMTKIIQTNLSIDNEGVIRDHQSLSYEVTSWEDLIDGVKEGRIEAYNSTMPFGRNRSKKPISRIKVDAFHMTVEYADNTKSLFYSVTK